MILNKDSISFIFCTASASQTAVIGAEFSRVLIFDFHDRLNVSVAVDAPPGAGKSVFASAIMKGLNPDGAFDHSGVTAVLSQRERLLWEQVVSSKEGFQHLHYDAALLQCANSFSRVNMFGNLKCQEMPISGQPGIHIIEHALASGEGMSYRVRIEDNFYGRCRLLKIKMPENIVRKNVIKKRFIPRIEKSGISFRCEAG